MAGISSPRARCSGASVLPPHQREDVVSAQGLAQRALQVGLYQLLLNCARPKGHPPARQCTARAAQLWPGWAPRIPAPDDPGLAANCLAGRLHLSSQEQREARCWPWFGALPEQLRGRTQRPSPLHRKLLERQHVDSRRKAPAVGPGRRHPAHTTSSVARRGLGHESPHAQPFLNEKVAT